MADLDAIDRALLAAVQRDARTSQTALGARVGLSAAAVNRRLRRLNDDGYIARTCAVLDPKLMGYPITIIAQVEVVSEQRDDLDALQHTFVACPHVQQCYYVAGEWDFVLILSVRDMDQYNDLTRTLFFGNDNVKRFKTLVAMHRSKTSLEIPTS